MNAVTLAKGINPTCCLHNDGAVYLAVQPDPKGSNPWRLVVWRYSRDLSNALLIGVLDLTTDTSANPRFLTRLDGALWLAFKEDAHGTLVAVPLTNLLDRRLLAPGVQGHLAARAHLLAWQVGVPGPVFRSWDLEAPTHIRNSDDSEGLWAIRDDGYPLLRYECRELRLDLGTYPSTAGPVTLAENFRDGMGLLGEWQGVPGRLHVFPGGDTKDPHLSFREGSCAVAAWGVATRLAVVTSADVMPDEPEPIEPPHVSLPEVQPQQGTAPLDVRVSVTLSGGPCDVLTVSASAPGVPEVQIVKNDPPAQGAYILRQLGAGRYTINASAYGVGGTAAAEVPNAVTVTAKPVEEPTVKPRDQFDREFTDVNNLYGPSYVHEGQEVSLLRPGGMVIDVNGVPTCDVVAMRQWGYDLLGENRPVAEVKNAIVRSEEWRQKHPGQTPPTFR